MAAATQILVTAVVSIVVILEFRPTTTFLK